MMLQFAVFNHMGARWLCRVDPSRYDFWWGFYRPIKELPK